MEEKLLAILKDKKKLLALLIGIIQESDKETSGLSSLCQSLTREDPNTSPANMARCIAAAMQVTAKQSKRIETLAIIALIQCQSSGFDTDIAHMLNKMGLGNEAVRTMFESKLNGK